MLESLISSKTRLKMLLKFFVNPDNSAYLRGLAAEFSESTNAVRLELNRFEEAGLLQSEESGNKRIYQANQRHPLFGDIRSIMLKHVGIDRIIENLIERLGHVQRVYVCGDLAQGTVGNLIDLLIFSNVDRTYLGELVEKAERLLDRKIRYVLYDPDELLEEVHGDGPALLIWEAADVPESTTPEP